MKVKGSVLRARWLFVSGRHPEVAETVKRLGSIQLRKAIEQGFVVSEWYEWDQCAELTRLIDVHAGKGDGALYSEMGRFACDENLRGIYRVFLRIGFIHHMLRRVGQAWSVHYDRGKMTVPESTKNSAVLRIMDVPTPGAEHCKPILAWCKRATELAGCRDVHAETLKCRRRGDDVCEFAVKWR